ncbi:MAG: divalent-cation tolerance protein CutA [Microcoleaceae cyanobacterium]
MNRTTGYGVVFVTASSRQEAEAIATALVQAQLAACVSFTPIHSIYTWNEEICSDEEWQLMIKTDLNQFEALETKILSLHSYEVPEIIAIPIVTGSTAYLNWIGTMIK